MNQPHDGWLTKETRTLAQWVFAHQVVWEWIVDEVDAYWEHRNPAPAGRHLAHEFRQILRTPDVLTHWPALPLTETQVKRVRWYVVAHAVRHEHDPKEPFDCAG